MIVHQHSTSLSRIAIKLATLVALLLVLTLASASSSFATTTLAWSTRTNNTDLLAGTDTATNVGGSGVTVTTHTVPFGGVLGANNSTIITPGAIVNMPATGYVWMQMTASSNAGLQGQTTTFTFSEPVYNLQFTVYDIDGGATCNNCQFNDIVDFSSDNGFPTAPAIGAGVTYNAATGHAITNQNTNVTNATGNITLNWTVPVTSVTVKHTAGQSAGGPANQYIGIGDLTFKASPHLTLQKTSTGGVGTFNFSTDNTWSGSAAPFISTSTASTLTTVTAGTTVTAPTPLKLYPINTASNTSETASGYIITPTPVVCKDANSAVSTNPATFNAAVAGNVVTIAAANNLPEAQISCNITNAKRPTVQIAKTTLGSTGTFNFTGDNGYLADTLTTATAGTAVNGLVRTLTTAATTTTLSETTQAGWVATAGSCTGTSAANYQFNPATSITPANIVLNAAATAPANALVCTFTNTKLASITLTKISNGATGGFTFNGVAPNINGFASQIITTAVSGTAVTGSIQFLSGTVATGTPTTIAETIPIGYLVASINCAGMGTGGTATTTLSSGTVVFNAAATVPGSNITCTYVNNKIPTVAFRKQSLGGTASFAFSAPGNLASAPAPIDTSVANPGPAAPTAINVTAISTAVTLTEASVAGYSMTGFACTDSNSAVTNNTGTFGSFDPVTRIVTIPVAKVVAGAVFTCTITNTKLPTITLTKTSFGAVGAFSFTGDNGFGTPSISTTASGISVTGTPQVLTAASTKTTISETIPSGYAISGLSCGNLGTGGTATVTQATGTVVLDAAATAPGAAITCSYSNDKLPVITLTKISNGGFGSFDFTGTDGFVLQTIKTLASGTGVAGAAQTLTTANVPVSITENAPSGYVVTNITCSGFGTGGAVTPSIPTATVNLDKIANAPGSNIACTFTNAKLPTVTLTKISNGAFGPFNFSGTNGFKNQTITTLAVGTPAAGSLQTLSAPSTSTSITEAIPTGFIVSGIACSNLGSGGTATTDLATGKLILDINATAPGAAITCTYTNDKAAPSLKIVKSASSLGPYVAGQTVTYTYTVTNNGNVPVTNIKITDTHNGTGAFTGPNQEKLITDLDTIGDSTDTTLNDGVWDVLGVHDTITFTATYVVTQHDVDFL